MQDVVGKSQVKEDEITEAEQGGKRAWKTAWATYDGVLL